MAKLNKNTQTILAIGGVIIVLGFLAKKSVAATVEAIADVNAGTAFEGAGVVGTIGNITDQASGGLLSNVGSAIGTFFSGSFFDRRTIDDLSGG